MEAQPPFLQRIVDSAIRRVLLPVVPDWVRPNHVTVVRLALTPVLVVLYVQGRIGWAIAVFVVAASTDFVDGAMARTRDQVTPLGTTVDPIADKLLIGAVLACVGWGYVVVKVIVIALALELLSVVGNYAVNHRSGKVLPANWFGKSKMIVQVFGVGLFLIARLGGFATLVTISVYLLWVSLGLAVVSGVLQAKAGATALSEQRTA